MRRFVGFMVFGALAIATLPTGLLILIFRLASGDLGPISATAGIGFVIMGTILALTSWRLRPEPLDEAAVEALRARDD